MDIDILKVVNDFLEKKDSPIDKDLGKVNSEDAIRIEKQEFLSDKELDSIIYELFTNGGNLKLLSKLSEKYLVDEDVLIQALKEKGYQKLWANKEITFFPNTEENLKVLEIVSKLNSGMQIDFISAECGYQREELLQILKNKGFIPYWIRVSNKYEFNIICDLGDMSILRNAETGLFKYIIFSNNLTLTIKQTNLLLGINSFYYSNINESKSRFIEKIHYYKLNKEQVHRMITSDPALSFLVHTPFLFTLKGIDLLMEVSRKENNYNKEYLAFLKKQGFILDNIGLKDNILISESNLENIVKELNNGKSIEEVSLKWNLTLETIKNGLTKANYKYNKQFELWTHCNNEQFIEGILHQLNNGLRIYDIASKFVNERSKRLNLSTKLINKLESEGYIFNKENRKWEKNIEEYDTQYFVTSLNNGVLFSELESITGLKRTEIRMRLKSEGIFLDYKTDKWIRREDLTLNPDNENTTKKELGEIKKIDPEDIFQIVSALNKGLSFSEIESLTGLKRQEIKSKFKTKAIYFDFNKNLWKQKENIVNDLPPQKIFENDLAFTEKKEEKSTNSFDVNEVTILKELIKNYTASKSKGKNEFKIIIHDDVYEKLNYYTEVFETSKSILIEKALLEYFEKNKYE